MSDETKTSKKEEAPVEAVAASVDAPVADEGAVRAISPNATISGLSAGAGYWFNPYLTQTFAGAVVSGYAQPTLSGNGYGGVNNTGFVFQNDQYNTTTRGF